MVQVLFGEINKFLYILLVLRDYRGNNGTVIDRIEDEEYTLFEINQIINN